jgi:hypothetical protein
VLRLPQLSAAALKPTATLQSAVEELLSEHAPIATLQVPSWFVTIDWKPDDTLKEPLVVQTMAQLPEAVL